MNTSAGFLTLILTVVTEVLLAQSSIVQVSKAQLPVKIDGVLNESIWQTSAPISLAFETDPANNKPATVQTTCYIAYDEENLYLACMAEDPDPGQIRAFITDGKINSNGYIVEASIPFKSLRFPNSKGVQTWNYYIARKWPRSNDFEFRSTTWDRDNNCQLCQTAQLSGLQNIKPGNNIQITPTFTGNRRDEAPVDGEPLRTGPFDTNFGLDFRWGITSNLTLNSTLNPDFSQVEADVAQFDVNNRFALRFPEKRPFFLEGADLFNTPEEAFFTRRIVEPYFGAKVTGKLGSNVVGIVAAKDRFNNLILPNEQGSNSISLDDDVTTVVGRFRRDVGKSSNIGILYTGREGNDYFNRVGGIDLFNRPIKGFSLRTQFLVSTTSYPEQVAIENNQISDTFQGEAFSLEASYNTRNYEGEINYISRSSNFRADAGFIPQVGIRQYNAWFRRVLWADNSTWFTKWRFTAGGFKRENLDGRLNNQELWGSISYDGPGQLNIWAYHSLFRKEYYEGEIYDLPLNFWSGYGFAPTGNIRVNGSLVASDWIDFDNSRKARRHQANIELNIRLGRRFDLGLDHRIQRMSRNGIEIFTANISQVKTVYNFTNRLFLRSIVQFRHTRRNIAMYIDQETDHVSKSLFTQWLLSYKLNPQSVIFIGYSNNSAGFTDSDLNKNEIVLTDRTFFFKTGFAWRPSI